MKWAAAAAVLLFCAWAELRRPDALEAPARPGAPAAAASPLFTREEPQAAAALAIPAGLFEGLAVRAGAVPSALAEAHAGRLHGAELFDRLRAAPDGDALLHALLEERSPEIALQLARALAELQDDDGLRTRTVASLRAAPESARTVGLLALLGREEPDALALATDTLVNSRDAETRATAAFVLGNVTAPPERALAAARAVLQDSQEGARLREEAATLLGQEGAPREDLALLERLALLAEPAVRMRALAALDAAGGNLRSVCERIVADSAAPERLVQMAHAWLAAPR